MPQSPRKCTEFISTKNEKKSKKKCESFEVFHFKTLAYQQFNHSPEIFTYEKTVATSFATRQKVQMDSKYSVENGRGSEISKKRSLSARAETKISKFPSPSHFLPLKSFGTVLPLQPCPSHRQLQREFRACALGPCTTLRCT